MSLFSKANREYLYVTKTDHFANAPNLAYCLKTYLSPKKFAHKIATYADIKQLSKWSVHML